MKPLIRCRKWLNLMGVMIFATGCSGAVQQSVSQKQSTAEKVRWTLPKKAILNDLSPNLGGAPWAGKSYLIEVNGKPAGEYPSLRCTGPRMWYCSEVPREGVEQLGSHKGIASTVVLEPGRYTVTIGRATTIGSTTLDPNVFSTKLEFEVEPNKRYSYATMHSQGKYWAWIQRWEPLPKKGHFDATQTFTVVAGVPAPYYINAKKKVYITK